MADPLVFTLDPELTPELRAQIVTLWTEVTNAGGAVGFVPPVTEDRVRATAEKQFAGLGGGAGTGAGAGAAGDPDADRLLVARAGADGPLVAVLFFESMRFDLMAHWRLLKRVMVDPKQQGRGVGVALLAEAERVARDWGLAGLRLTARGGMGLEKFYRRCGYTEVGRVPGAIRVAPGDDRDDITFWLALDRPALQDRPAGHAYMEGPLRTRAEGTVP
ncbi:GNAT family N-acetyltransferase [Streptomyces tateyamensis]|uniref:GNAT family N-acetyltransferase n=1 Tax=Streptomyces tateyamensis TaxID=565073 RepID=A0A2V4NJ01_9ACTN|nr:GNAT family N-acetyltransferase [Streptomyces tateyamensis]PYC85353.1 GNAT family N-acetyltransferase [Streptomyces tateyamensis]